MMTQQHQTRRTSSSGPRRKSILVVVVAVLLLWLPSVSGAAVRDPEPAARGLRQVRAIATADLGLREPVAVTYRPSTGTLIATGRDGGGRTVVAEFTATDDPIAASLLVAEVAPSTLAVDPVDGRLTAMASSGLVRLSDPRDGPVTLDAPPPDREPVAEPGPATFDPESGTHYVAGGLDEVIVATAADGRRTELSLGDHLPGAVSGVAFDPKQNLLFAASGEAMISVDTDGQVVDRFQLSPSDVHDPGGMVIAPSSDATDEEHNQSLFIADGGQGGAIVEMSLESTPAGPAPEAISASLVRTYDLSALTPPSPDSAGVVHLPDRGVLMVSDSEVNEMPIYAGRNLFAIEPVSGAATGIGATTLAFSSEPTGVGYDVTSQHLFVSDDNANEIFEVDPGADGIYGNGDDQVTSFDTAVFGAQDAEDVAYADDTLYIIDGVNSEVYVVDAGANGIFDGVPAQGGDDVVSQFDVGVFGLQDPEGIEYWSATQTLYIVDRRTDAVYEVTTSGTLLNTIDITAADPVAAAGVAVAPASDGSGASHLYIVDRGVDNGADPNENDGLMYEMTGLDPTLCNGLSVTVDIGLGQSPTGGPDVIRGTPGADVISALGGDDVICAEGGNDTISGGPGADVVLAGDGDDTASGQDGNDTLIGGLGADQLLGFGGADVLEGGDANDVLNGGIGDDVLDGGAGADQLFAQGGADIVRAGAGDDLVIGSEGNDVIEGGAGHDVLNGGPGSDDVSGGSGNDTIYGLGGDDLQLAGEAGADLVFGQLGADVVDGGPGNDQLWGNEQNDVITDPSGVNIINGGPDHDTITGGSGGDQIYGDGNLTQAGNDVITGGSGVDVLLGFAGADSIDAVDGVVDTVNAGPGIDVCTVDPADVAYNCET